MLRLLLVDDNPDDRRLIIRHLQREFPQLQVAEVCEAESFHSALSRENFDIAIIDYCLRWNDGLTVLSEIKSRFPHCPAIMFSDSGDREIAVEAMKAGLDDYIVKSAKNYDRLTAAVGAALKRAEDASKLRRVQAAVYLSEQRLRLSIDCVKDYAIFMLDCNGYITSWNSGAEQILGYQETEIVGQHGKCIFTAEDRDRGIPQQEFSTAATVGRATDERWHLRKNGSLFWASGSVTPLRDEAGNLLGFSKILRDMTEPKQAQEALQKKQEHLELAQTAAKLGSFEWNIQTSVITWSKELEALYGLKPGSFGSTYQNWARYVHPKDLPQAEAAVQASLVSGSFFTDFRAIWSDGSIHWLHARAKVFFDREGKPLRMVGVNVDITERKMAEDALQQLNGNLESLVHQRTFQLQKALQFEGTLKRITEKLRDSLDESQILQTAVGELALALNVTCCNTSMYDLEKGTSQIYYEYATSNGGAQARTISLAAFPEVYQQLLQRQYCQFCSLTPNPVRGRVAMLATPIFDDRSIFGDLWAIAMPDRTFNELEIGLVQQVASACAIAIRQARLYKAAKAQVAQLEKLNALKDDFINTVSHELRTPMASIKMAISMLEINLRQAGLLAVESNRAAQYLQILARECDREISLIDDLLDLSRLEAGNAPLDLTTLDLKAWIPPIIESFSERARSQQQSLLVDIPPDLPALTTNTAQLERVLTELLHNACKYTPPREQISIGATAQSDKLRLQVSNSGVEIPASELSQIFEKFYRIPNNDPWKHGGTGLGLALVKKLVGHLGGNIKATASNGWTTFTVELPI